MSKKIVYGFITIVIFCLAGFGAYMYDKSLAPANSGQTAVPNASNSAKNSFADNRSAQGINATTSVQSNQKPPAPKSTTTPADKPVFSSGEAVDTGSGIQVYEVDFDGTKMNPKEITVKVGDYIFFKNKSTVNFLPVSSGAGYLNFGAVKPVAPGSEYRFQFTKIGRLEYRDQAVAAAVGTVIVIQ